MGISEVFSLLAALLLFATLIAAATTDILHRKVYNSVTYPGVALGLALGFGVGGVGESVWVPGLLSSLAGCGLAFGLLFVAWWGRMVGGGEVKLAAAVGALGGLPFTISVLFWTGLVGAVFSLCLLIWRGRLLSGLGNSLRFALSLRARVENPDDPLTLRLPYAVSFAFGTMVAWFLEVPGAVA